MAKVPMEIALADMGGMGSSLALPFKMEFYL